MIDVITQKTKKPICITFIQRRPNVFDVGQTLYKCYTKVLCFLGNAHNTPPPPTSDEVVVLRVDNYVITSPSCVCLTAYIVLSHFSICYSPPLTQAQHTDNNYSQQAELDRPLCKPVSFTF